jgi:hypothetical protein
MPERQGLFRSASRAFRDADPGPDFVDLRPLCQPIQDQGMESSCTGQMAKCLCDLAQRAQKGPGGVVPSSALFPYANGRALEWGKDAVLADFGAYISRVLESLTVMGNVPFFAWGTEADQDNVRASQTIDGECLAARATETPHFALYEEGYQHRISFDSWYRIHEQGEALISEIERIVATKHGVGFGGPVSEAYTRFVSSGVAPIDPSEGQEAGMHAQVIVGYERRDRLFLLRNSWGKGFGDAGYAWVPYRYMLSPRVGDFSTVLRSA